MSQAQKDTNGTVPVKFVSTPGYGVADDYPSGSSISEKPINSLDGDGGNLEIPKLDNGGGVNRERVYKEPAVSQGLKLNSGNVAEVADSVGEIVGGDSNRGVGRDMGNQVGNDTDNNHLNISSEPVDGKIDGDGTRSFVNKLEGGDTVITGTNIMKEPTNKEMQVREDNPGNNLEGVGIKKLETEIQTLKDQLRELEKALQEKQEEVARVMKGIEVLGVNEENVTVLEQELKDSKTAVDNKRAELQKAINELAVLKNKKTLEASNTERGEISEDKKLVEVVIADGGLLGAISEGIARLGLDKDSIPEMSDKAFGNFTKTTLNELVQEGMNREEAVEAFRAMMKSWAANKTAISVELLNNEGGVKVSIVERSKATENTVGNNKINSMLNDGATDDYNSLQKAA